MPKLQNSRKTCVFDNIQSDYFQFERMNKEVKIRKVRKRVSKIRDKLRLYRHFFITLRQSKNNGNVNQTSARNN